MWTSSAAEARFYDVIGNVWFIALRHDKIIMGWARRFIILCLAVVFFFFFFFLSLHGVAKKAFGVILMWFSFIVILKMVMRPCP